MIIRSGRDVRRHRRIYRRAWHSLVVGASIFSRACVSQSCGPDWMWCHKKLGSEREHLPAGENYPSDRTRDVVRDPCHTEQRDETLQRSNVESVSTEWTLNTKCWPIYKCTVDGEVSDVSMHGVTNRSKLPTRNFSTRYGGVWPIFGNVECFIYVNSLQIERGYWSRVSVRNLHATTSENSITRISKTSGYYYQPIMLPRLSLIVSSNFCHSFSRRANVPGFGVCSAASRKVART